MRIAVVNDSLTAVQVLSRLIEESEDFELAWTAYDGEQAVEKCRVDRPDLILMDLIMPHLDGVEATRRIMKSTPCPILIVTSSVERNVGEVFEAMGAGAVDAVATPPMATAEGRRLLFDKIAAIAAMHESAETRPRQSAGESVVAESCIIIGSSAGGPAALMEIIPKLPPTLRSAVIIVQHIDSRFSSEMAVWLDAKCSLPVRLAAEGELPRVGNVLIAEGGRHLVFLRDRTLHYTAQPRLPYQPSADVFFESALRFGPPRLLAAILTGMGRDGARGLKLLRDAGHATIAQDEATSAIFGMPRAAIELGGASEILPLSSIAGRITEWSSRN